MHQILKTSNYQKNIAETEIAECIRKVSRDKRETVKKIGAILSVLPLQGRFVAKTQHVGVKMVPVS